MTNSVGRFIVKTTCEYKNQTCHRSRRNSRRKWINDIKNSELITHYDISYSSYNMKQLVSLLHFVKINIFYTITFSSLWSIYASVCTNTASCRCLRHSHPQRRKIASTPESISGFTLRLRSMKVTGELVVDRMWKLGKRRNLMIESRLRGWEAASSRQWKQRWRPSNNCDIVGMASLLPNRPQVITWHVDRNLVYSIISSLTTMVTWHTVLACSNDLSDGDRTYERRCNTRVL